jgi:hypothetical protein
LPLIEKLSFFALIIILDAGNKRMESPFLSSVLFAGKRNGSGEFPDGGSYLKGQGN